MNGELQIFKSEEFDEIRTIEGDGNNMNELIKVNYDSDRPTVLARDLYDFLEVATDYSHWFPRMCEYGFTENIDFNSVKNDRVQMKTLLCSQKPNILMN